jgi:hypothetical protein
VLDAHVADLHAGHRAVVAVQRQRGGEAREHVDPELFGLRRQPLVQAAERDDEVSFVVQGARQPRYAPGAVRTEDAEFIARDRHAQRQRRRAPCGQ